VGARRARFAPFAVALACSLALLATTPAGAVEAPVGLGTATSFAILAGAGVTSTGATTITGDIGMFPTTSQTGFATIVRTGVNHAGDAVTQQAKLDLVDAFTGLTNPLLAPIGLLALAAGIGAVILAASHRRHLTT